MVWAVPKILWATGTPRRRMEESSTSSILRWCLLVGARVGESGKTYSREDVWSIPMTFVIIARLFSGTFSQALNAAISCFRMSFPG